MPDDKQALLDRIAELESLLIEETASANFWHAKYNEINDAAKSGFEVLCAHQDIGIQADKAINKLKMCWRIERESGL